MNYAFRLLLHSIWSYFIEACCICIHEKQFSSVRIILPYNVNSEIFLTSLFSESVYVRLLLLLFFKDLINSPSHLSLECWGGWFFEGELFKEKVNVFKKYIAILIFSFFLYRVAKFLSFDKFEHFTRSSNLLAQSCS